MRSCSFHSISTVHICGISFNKTNIHNGIITKLLRSLSHKLTRYSLPNSCLQAVSSLDKKRDFLIPTDMLNFLIVKKSLPGVLKLLVNLCLWWEVSFNFLMRMDQWLTLTINTLPRLLQTRCSAVRAVYKLQRSWLRLGCTNGWSTSWTCCQKMTWHSGKQRNWY